MSYTSGTIHGANFTLNDDGEIHIEGDIDGGSTITLATTNGSIIIDGKIDEGSQIILSATGVIQIGAAGTDPEHKKIDGGSNVKANASGDISLGGRIDGSSTADFTSDNGSITIGGKIDQNGFVTLKAAGNISIGEAGNGGDERKIDGNSNVDAIAGGTIHLFGRIDGGSILGGETAVDFRACRGITIDDKIDGGSHVRLAVSTGSSNIGDRIGGGGTEVLYWPPDRLQVKNGIDSNGAAIAFPWTNLADWCKQRPGGYYWHDLPSAAAR